VNDALNESGIDFFLVVMMVVVVGSSLLSEMEVVVGTNFA
jgi:hypothetical protein